MEAAEAPAAPLSQAVNDPLMHSPDVGKAAAAAGLATGARSFAVGGAGAGLHEEEEEEEADVPRSKLPPASVLAPPVRSAEVMHPYRGPSTHLASPFCEKKVPRAGVPSHWTPIGVGRGKDPIVELCKLNYDAYWRMPHKLPMFKVAKYRS